MAYSFDEEDLRTSLSSVGKLSQAIFAASCATRLLPQYKEYLQKFNQNRIDQDPLVNGLSYLWDNLTAERKAVNDIDDIVSACAKSLPDEEEAYDIGAPYAADAAAAIYYAVSVYQSDSIQNAIWSARRIYEALDNYIANEFDIDPSSLEGEKKVLEHPLMQKELLRQTRDIRELLSIGESVNASITRRFYSQALSEASEVFR